MKKIILSTALSSLLLLTGCSIKNENIKLSDAKLLDELVALGHSLESNNTLEAKYLTKVKTNNLKIVNIYKTDDLKTVIKKIKKLDEDTVVELDKYLADNSLFISFKNNLKLKNIDDLVEYINNTNSNMSAKVLNKTSKYKSVKISYRHSYFNKLKNIKYENGFYNSPLDEVYGIAYKLRIPIAIADEVKKQLVGLKKDFYKGNAYEYIRKLSKEKNLYYSIDDNGIVISKIKEKNYSIDVANFETNIETKSSAKNKDQQLGNLQSDSSITIANKLYNDLDSDIKSILELDSKVKGSFSLNRSSSQLTVNASSNELSKVDKKLRFFNETYSKNIIVKLKLVEVLLNKKHQNGIDLNVLNAGLKLETELGTSSLASVSSNSLSFSSEKLGSIIKALNQFGETKVVSSPYTSTLNTIETSMFLGETKEYLSDISTQTNTTTTGTINPTYQTESKTVNSGLNLIIKPTIKNDNVQIMMQVKMASLQGFDVNQVGDTTTKSAEVKKRDFLHIINLKKGESFLLAGIKEHYSKKNKQGMPYIDERDKWYDYIAGEKNLDEYDLEFALIVSIEIDE